MNHNETMVVKVHEYHDLLIENKRLRERVAQLEEEIKRLKSASGLADTAQ